MRTLLLPLAFGLVLAASPALRPGLAHAEDKPDDGFKPMFNGKNLDGWRNVNCAPGTFFTKGEEVITTGEPTGFLATGRQYENFILEMDWMHVEKEKMANSGLFVWGDPLPGVGTPYTRGIEVQVLINYKPKDGWATSHGDLFSIHGARCTPDRPHFKGIERCLPSEDRVKGGGEWNHYKVIANDGAIKLHVNGKEVSGVSKCTPRKGYLALESEGAECHFKNLKIKELPSTNPKPEEIAKVFEGHMSLFNGIDLKGWDQEKETWKVSGGVIKATGNDHELKLAPVKKSKLEEVVFDWKSKTDRSYVFHIGGFAFETGSGKAGAWNRTVVTCTASRIDVATNGKPAASGLIQEHPSLAVTFKSLDGLEIMNVFARELKEK